MEKRKIMLLFTFILDNEQDRSFLESVYTRYYPILKYTAANICGMDMADDAIQAAFLKLINHLDTLKELEEKPLVTYLVYTVKSVAIDLQRKASQQSRIKQKLIHHSSYYDSPDTADLSIDIQSVLSQLSERDRDLLVYCYFFNLDQKKVAEIMGIKPANIRMAIYRAKKRALKLLNKEGDKNDNK